MLLRATPAWSSVGGFSTTTIALASAPAPNGEGAGAHDAPAPPSTRVTCWHAAHCTDCAVPAYASVRPHPAHWQCATAWFVTFTVEHTAHRTEVAPLSYARRTWHPAQSNWESDEDGWLPSGTAVTVEHNAHRTFDAPCASRQEDERGVGSASHAEAPRAEWRGNGFASSREEGNARRVLRRLANGFASPVAVCAVFRLARREAAFCAHVSRMRASGVARVPAGTPAACDSLRPHVRCIRRGGRSRLGLRAEGEGVSVWSGVDDSRGETARWRAFGETRRGRVRRCAGWGTREYTHPSATRPC